MNKNNLIYLIIIGLITACNPSKDSTKPAPSGGKTVLLLGVYHFNNPGKDTYNIEVENYFSDRRQREIEEVVTLLEAFRPNKIFVERSVENQLELDSLYLKYIQGQLSLKEINGGQNEVYQLGFRLGKNQGISQIQAIDYPGNWLGPYVDFIADTLKDDHYLADRNRQTAATLNRQERYNTNSIRQNLLELNSWDQIMKNHHYYNNVAIRVRDTAGTMYTYQQMEQEINGLPYYLRSFDFENIGIELVAEWYKRNLFIYRNILESTAPDDRVLIVFGSGHIRYLHQLLSDHPEFNILSPTDYLSVN